MVKVNRRRTIKGQGKIRTCTKGCSVFGPPGSPLNPLKPKAMKYSA